MAEFQNFAEMFAQSIGVKEPWKIERAYFDEKVKEVHVYVSARKTAKYSCPVCGTASERYDDEDVERVWQHGDVVFFPCFVHCRRPRVKCKEHGIHVVEAPWARKGSRFTLLFESYAMLLLEAMTVNEARKFLRISHTALTNIMVYWVNKAVDEQDLSNVEQICIDETSFKRGQSYVTVIADTAAKRVIDVENGRDSETVNLFSKQLETKGGDCNKIKYVTSDMSAAYKAGIELCFPNATQIIDKFHVKKMLLDAMNEVRIAEQGRQAKNRSMGRKLMMILLARMTAQQLAKKDELSKRYPKTGRAFRMVQGLDDIYACMRYTEAEEQFHKLYRWLRRSRLEPMKKAALTLMQHKDEILAYFHARLTNAIAEGLNSLIQAAKRKARGFRTYQGYRCCIFLQVGKLDFHLFPLFS